MKHVGDITKLRGIDLEPVDVVTGGSPCQDLSVAGLRAGLAGERSGLFMEQIRIVKELRENDRQTNRGTDKPLRPRYMVWENVPGAFSSNKGEDFRAVLEEIVKIVRPDAPAIPLPDGGRWPKSGAFMGRGTDGVLFSIAYRLHDAQLWGVPQRRKRLALVADFAGLTAPEILFKRQGMSWRYPTGNNERENAPAGAFDGAIRTSQNIKCYSLQRIGEYKESESASALKYRDYKDYTDLIVYPAEPENGPRVRRLTPLECERLQGFPDGWTDIGPWADTKGKAHKESSDAARYKALGNSIALPFWLWLLRRIAAQYERPATLGSLFDGIGGFPLCWERCNGPGTARWASEIEEFPIAVTKAHFPEPAGGRTNASV